MAGPEGVLSSKGCEKLSIGPRGESNSLIRMSVPFSASIPLFAFASPFRPIQLFLAIDSLIRAQHRCLPSLSPSNPDSSIPFDRTERDDRSVNLKEVIPDMSECQDGTADTRTHARRIQLHYCWYVRTQQVPFLFSNPAVFILSK